MAAILDLTPAFGGFCTTRWPKNGQIPGLYNDNYMEDYHWMDENDQYESVGLDDSMEDERDIDQIMEDRKAAEVELDAKGNMGPVSRKLPRFCMIKVMRF
ncbi:DNA replication licensing factor MCM2-like [Magnolia sinica]|uniref:DNA replication licensing factor MCM2-like n=1 Tax=Magnolia sinica TaxID=86752 RepID=UPI002658AEF9|nr:DNA replication licensing factor MCM2-like [Magnolia sinica]